MGKVFVVARREFLATVRTKAFILSVVLMPALIVGAIFGTEKAQDMAEAEQIPTRTLAVVDHTGEVLADLQQQVAAWNQKRPNQKYALEPIDPNAADADAIQERVIAGELYGYLKIYPGAVAGDEGALLARKDNQLTVGRQLSRMVETAVTNARLRAAELDVATIAGIYGRGVPIEMADAFTGEEKPGNELARVMTPFAFMFLLFMGTFGISQGLLTTLIEEKSSRVVEVLLSAVSPLQLMAGKILGTVMVGFVLLVVWGGVGVAGARSYDVTELVSGYRLTIAVLYFVPGFLLIASILAAIGSACNELKDAQSMAFPLSLITIIPMIFWFYIAEYPASIVSVVLSYVPIITPFIMILRVCADPDTPMLQIVTTLAVLWASVLVVMWAAGKIFRVGVLMYGKPPSPAELLRWVRRA